MEKSSHPPPYEASYSHSHPPATTVIIGGQMQPPGMAPTVILGPTVQFGPASQSVVCPHCRSQILTKVETETTTKTHLIALLLCVFCCLPCVCVPYCMDSCKNKNHYCPSCGAFLGAHDS